MLHRNTTMLFPLSTSQVAPHVRSLHVAEHLYSFVLIERQLSRCAFAYRLSDRKEGDHIISDSRLVRYNQIGCCESRFNSIGRLHHPFMHRIYFVLRSPADCESERSVQVVPLSLANHG